MAQNSFQHLDFDGSFETLLSVDATTIGEDVVINFATQ